MQINNFLEGRTQVIVSTDAIGMGLNLPIKRVVFLEMTKFDGTRRRFLTNQEIKQIGGRAGRKGLYNIGLVSSTVQSPKQLEQALSAEDPPIHHLTIKPTVQILAEYARFSKDLAGFFQIWKNYTPPKGMFKAKLTQERALYGLIKGTPVAEKFSLPDLYRYISMPFSYQETELQQQWRETLRAIANHKALPEPVLSGNELHQLELNYKKIGLHLLFLYSLHLRKETFIWEKERQIASGHIQDYLQSNLALHIKKCKYCNKKLSWDYPHSMCNSCYQDQYFYEY
ncbi:helicase-related protein [Ectobacillus panaciterrae]|uniref:helicase-related protein n=1 Tax=Ectobacillus panaciterrae TaxID=363872 RepID=UPI000415875C|nr:helicase-related protein [Ectobacillus panaciterrae]